MQSYSKLKPCLPCCPAISAACGWHVFTTPSLVLGPMLYLTAPSCLEQPYSLAQALAICQLTQG